jgi:hypothetical protein
MIWARNWLLLRRRDEWGGVLLYIEVPDTSLSGSAPLQVRETCCVDCSDYAAAGSGLLAVNLYVEIALAVSQ